MALTSSVSDKYNSLSVFDENFGMGMDFNKIKRQFREWVENQSSSYPVVKSNDSEATVTTLDDKFQVTIDVYQFKSEEITIKVLGSNTICIEGNHEEQHENCGFLTRHFVRKYTLPNGYDIKNVVSTLSSDGILRIIAPRNGQTIDDYCNITLQQSNASLQNNTQMQYNEENVTKNSNTYHEVPIQGRSTNQEVSGFQNQQTHNNTKESNTKSAQTTKQFEKTHNYIQQYLHNIDRNYKFVPIKQVGPYTKLEEHTQESRIDNTINGNLQQRQETFKNVRECRTVPIQQTTATYNSLLDAEITKQTETNYTPKSQNQAIKNNQTKSCDIRSTESSNKRLETVNQNRKCSTDTEEKYIQKEVVQEFRTVPIQQTEKQSNSTIELIKTHNWETNITKENAPQQYKTIPIQQTGNNTKYDIIQDEIVRNHNILEEINTGKSEKQIYDEQNYKSIPIQQTGVVSQTSKDETNKHLVKNNSIESQIENVTHLNKTEQCNKIQNPKVIPNAQNREENKVINTEFIEKSTQETRTEHSYKTIPIKQTGNVFQTNETSNQTQVKTYATDLQQNNKTTEFDQANMMRPVSNDSQVPTSPAEQLDKSKHPHNLNNTMKNVKSIEESTTKEIYNIQEYKTIPHEKKNIKIDKDETEEQIVKTTSRDAQCKSKNTTNFEETETHSFSNNLQEQTKSIENHKRKEYNIKNAELEKDVMLQNEKEIHNYETIPNDCFNTDSQVTKHETYEQRIFKTDSLESQHNIENVKDFEETKSWGCNSSKAQNVVNRTPHEHVPTSTDLNKNYSNTSNEQEMYKRNVTNTNETNKKSNEADVIQQKFQNNLNYSQDTETCSTSRKTSKYTHESSNNSNFDSQNLLESSNHNKYGTQLIKQDKLSQHTDSSLANTTQQNALASRQNELSNLVFQENDSTKEDSVVDGYKQRNITNKNSKAEFVELPHGYKVTKEQSFYSEQTKTKGSTGNACAAVDQGHNNTYQVQFSVDSSNSEKLSRMPSETSEICIEEVTEENETKMRTGGSSGYRKHETSQFVSNSDHTIRTQRN